MAVITLGSASPRRLELLEKLKIDVVVKPPNIDEVFDTTLTVEENAKKIALDKLNNVKLNNPDDEFIITADTFIALGNRTLGKPANREDAFNMLSMLSGKSHRVLTGISVYSREESRSITEVDTTEVCFKELTAEEINYYLDFNEWQDAAGAYQIQNMGEILVDSINGSYSSVMGLPISRIYGIFVALNFINPVM